MTFQTANIQEAPDINVLPFTQVEKKLFILVRKDLPHSVRLVQAGHAIANFAYKNATLIHETLWGPYGPSFVVFGVRDEEELRHWQKEFPQSEAFIEPDFNHELTALAIYGYNNPAFKGLKLL